MFIYWGTKITRKDIGRVADFCFVCRDFRPFRGAKIDSVGHIYSIPLGSRTTLGYTRTCETCGCTFRMQPESYSMLSSDRRASLDALIVETHPRIWQNCYDRLQVERRARDGQLSADERREYILEPFVLLNHRVEERASDSNLDPFVCLGILATIGSLFYGMTFLGHRSPVPGQVPGEVVVGICLVCVAFLMHAIANQSRRFTRRRVLPVIVESLRPVHPTAGELDAAVRHLRRMKSPIGKALQVKDVWKAFGIDNPASFAPGFPT